MIASDWTGIRNLFVLLSAFPLFFSRRVPAMDNKAGAMEGGLEVFAKLLHVPLADLQSLVSKVCSLSKACSVFGGFFADCKRS